MKTKIKPRPKNRPRKFSEAILDFIIPMVSDIFQKTLQNRGPQITDYLSEGLIDEE